MKQVSRHKAFWHVKKLNKAEDEPVTGENKEFLQVLLEARLMWYFTNFDQALLTEQYQGPLKKELAAASRKSKARLSEQIQLQVLRAS